MSTQELNGITQPRRKIVKTAAWSLPVIAAAIAAPQASASTFDVGSFRITGICGDLNNPLPGFALTADPANALPAETIVSIDIRRGFGNPFDSSSVTGGTALMVDSNAGLVVFVLTSALPAGLTMEFRFILPPREYAGYEATAAVPDGYVASSPTTFAQLHVYSGYCQPM